MAARSESLPDLLLLHLPSCRDLADVFCFATPKAPQAFCKLSHGEGARCESSIGATLGIREGPDQFSPMWADLLIKVCFGATRCPALRQRDLRVQNWLVPFLYCTHYAPPELVHPFTPTVGQ